MLLVNKQQDEVVVSVLASVMVGLAGCCIEMCGRTACETITKEVGKEVGKEGDIVKCCVWAHGRIPDLNLYAAFLSSTLTSSPSLNPIP